MIVNSGNLRTLNTSFNGAFKNGLGMAPPDYQTVATTVRSTTGKEEYGWLGSMPGMREWLGDRVVQNMATHDYTIKNRDWEGTYGVRRSHIEDDNIGIYSPMFTEIGRSVAAHPNEQVFGLLKAGFTTPCYDGQFFFDVDHPVLDASGTEISVANTDGGNGTPWFLIDDSRALKPIIYQLRKDPQFVAKDNPDDENVWRRAEFEYGVDYRSNVGFGFWQFAWGSRQPLTPANYAIGRTAISGMKGDYGRPLGLMPRTLVVPPQLEGTALKIVNSELIDAGNSNEWKGTAAVKVVPWLA